MLNAVNQLQNSNNARQYVGTDKLCNKFQKPEYNTTIKNPENLVKFKTISSKINANMMHNAF